MNPDQTFFLAVIAIVMFAGVVRMSIMAKHGYPLDRRSRRAMRNSSHPFAALRWWTRVGSFDDRPDDAPDAARKIELLTSENEKLVGQIGRLEERLRVLERIATDPAERTAREIDALRDQH